MSDDIYGLSRPTTPEVQAAEPVALEKPPSEKRAPSVAFGQLPDEIIGQYVFSPALSVLLSAIAPKRAFLPWGYSFTPRCMM
jgi:hypothetical protein